MKKLPAKKYGSSERQLVFYMEHLPPDFLLSSDTTEDQAVYWAGLRNFQILVATYWKSIHQGTDDPIRPLLDSGILKKCDYEQVILTGLFNERLWELIQIGFVFIKPELKKRGLEHLAGSARDLFMFIIGQEAIIDYSLCLANYYPVAGREHKKDIGLAVKTLKRKANEEEAVKAVQWAKKHFNFAQPKSNLPFLITLEVCNKRATGRQPALQSAFAGFQNALYSMLNHEPTLRREEGAYVWRKGEKKARKVGGQLDENS